MTSLEVRGILFRIYRTMKPCDISQHVTGQQRRPSKRTYFGVCAMLFLGASTPAQAQPDRVVIDGVFADWNESELIYTDPFGDGASGFDLGRVWATLEDGRFLLSIEFANEIGLQDGNALTLFLDTDADASTGLPVHGIGAELEWAFGRREGTAYVETIPLPVDHADLGLFSAPTVTSDRFELAIRYDAVSGSEPIFRSDSLALVIRDGPSGDILPDAPGGVRIALEDREVPPLPISLERGDPDHLRLVSYNVLSDGLFDPLREPYFQRLLPALQPDVLALQEVYGHSAEQIAAWLEAVLPAEDAEAWHVAGVGSDVFLASRYPIKRAEPLCTVPAIPSTCNGAFLLDLSARYAEDLYVIAAHPPCCGNDMFRQEEIDVMMAHLRDARADGRLPEETPFVIAGDLNLVGDAQQLRTLLTGDIFDNDRFGPDFAPDWDGSDLTDAIPPTTGVPAAFTWYSEGDSFHPGRLDFVIYSDAVVDLANRFALFTPALPPDLLDAFGLQADDAPFASDHLPVVSDLVLPQITTGSEENQHMLGLHLDAVYPNPARYRVSVRYTLPEADDAMLEVLDVLGRIVQRHTLPRQAAGAHEVQINVRNLPAGAYVLRLQAQSEVRTSSVVVLN